MTIRTYIITVIPVAVMTHLYFKQPPTLTPALLRNIFIGEPHGFQSWAHSHHVHKHATITPGLIKDTWIALGQSGDGDLITKAPLKFRYDPLSDAAPMGGGRISFDVS
jgi:hypothetical protein